MVDASVMGDVALRIEGLVLHARGSDGRWRPIVHGIDLDVGRREIVGLVGESGSGKSQTALAIARINPAGVRRAAGRIMCRGVDVSALNERQMQGIRGREVAYIFQEPMTALNPTMRLGVMIDDVLRVCRPDLGSGRADEAKSILRSLGLDDPEWVLNAYPHQLSGGMRQRVLIALAYACNPALIVADEPTTALDVTLQAQALDLIVSLSQKHDSAMLFISHDLAVVKRVCSRVYVMCEGRIVESGPTEAVISEPKDAYTQRLVASARAKEAFA